MNILEYTLRLNDKMSAVLNKIGGGLDNASGKGRKLKKDIEDINNVNFSGFYSKIAKVASVLGIGAIFGKTIKNGMEQEMRNVSFEVLFGGVDNAKRMIDQISDYAAKSPYGKAGLSEATQMMAGFGIAQEKIMPNLKMIGDIAMGDSEKFKSLTLAFSQMSSTGKLTGQDLLQMINAQFNPLTELEKMTGKTTDQLKDMMSKGLISSDMVTQAFQNATKEGGLYYGMIDKINGTVSGQWVTAMDNISEKMLNLYDNVLQPLILPALQKFNVFLDDPIGTIGRLTDKFTTSFPIITGVILAATAAVVGYKLAVFSLAATQVVIMAIKKVMVAYEIVVFAVRNATSLWTAAQWLINVAMTANPIGLVIAAIVALIAVIAFVIIKTDGWGKMWQHTVNGAKLIFKAYVESVKFYFNTMIDGLMIGLNYIKKGWYEFKEAVGIGDSSENQKMLAQIQADTDARKKSMLEGAKKVSELDAQSKKEFAAAFSSLSWNDTSFSDVANGIKNKLGISSPGISEPGIPGTGGSGGLNGGGSGGAGSTVGKDTANSIATGGSKTTHITINLGELVGTINISKNGFRESADNMTDEVLDAMTRVLSMAQGQI